MNVTRSIRVLIPIGIVVLAGCGGEPELVPAAPLEVATPEQVDDALRLAWEGRETEAIAALEDVARIDVDGPVGDRAALLLGSLRLSRHEAEEAANRLRRAMAGTVGRAYARLLFARAVVHGGLEESFEEAALMTTGLVADPDVRPLVVEEARLLLLEIRSAQGRFGEAAALGVPLVESLVPGESRDRARWLTAEALRQAGLSHDAAALYEGIWLETPGSPWGEAALRNLETLRPTAAGSVLEALSPEQRYELIQRLRAAGLHEHALAEVDELFRRHPGHPKSDGALLLQAMSLYQLRRNADVVHVADALRERFPRSQWVPAAQLWAIKALRRSDSTPEIRRRAEWVVARYPGHEKAAEALYNLGVYLGNLGFEEEGIEVLRRLVATGGGHENVVDALWKMAWMERARGNTAGAVELMEEILSKHPKSGYRKPSLYWIGRLVADRDPGRSRQVYEQCVEEFPNDYYGHLALENLANLGIRPARIGNGQRFPPVDRLEDPRRRADPTGSYATAANLKSIGLYELAAAELEGVQTNAGDPLRLTLAALYSRAGETWKAHAILVKEFPDFVRAGTRGDDNLVPPDFWHVLYPFRYRAEVEKALAETDLRGTQVDPWMVAALIRIESRFLATAVSPVGAIGLMQLMPDTAARIAEERHSAPPSRDMLFRPELNIRFGTYYLAKRVREFDGQWFPAICSYNAGVNPVRQWWAKRPAAMPDDEFIEGIPYVDTRLYVKQILGDYRNYRYHYPERG